MAGFTENESYMHKMAKEVFDSWCIYLDGKINVPGFYYDIGMFDRRGVYKEYPIVVNKKYNSVD